MHRSLSDRGMEKRNKIVKTLQGSGGLGITILGDDLYAKQPICLEVLDKNLNFIFVCQLINRIKLSLNGLQLLIR